MTLSPLERHDRRRRRRQSEWRRWGGVVVAALIVFGLGIALGQALHDNPKPGDTVTLERTLSIPSVPVGSTVSP